jgi:nicotinamide-nucleotide amidase
MMYDEKSLKQIRNYLIGKKQTLAVAESVSAGYLQAALSAAPDANCFFQGGLTAYNLGQKTRLLDVEPIGALATDCVSEQVAEQMARKVCELFLSDYGIAITGYATPVPEKGIKKLYAFVCIASKSETILTQKILAGNKKADKAQVHYVNTILAIFAKLLGQIS